MIRELKPEQVAVLYDKSIAWVAAEIKAGKFRTNGKGRGGGQRVLLDISDADYAQRTRTACARLTGTASFLGPTPLSGAALILQAMTDWARDIEDLRTQLAEARNHNQATYDAMQDMTRQLDALSAMFQRPEP